MTYVTGGRLLRFQKTCAILFGSRCELSQVLSATPLFCHWGLQPSEAVSPIKHFLLWADLVMMFYHDNRSNKRSGDTYLMVCALWYWHPAHGQELGTAAHRWLLLLTRQVPSPMYEAAPSHCVLKLLCWKQKEWVTVHTHKAMLRRTETQKWLTLVPSDFNYRCVGYQESGWGLWVHHDEPWPALNFPKFV